MSVLPALAADLVRRQVAVIAAALEVAVWRPLAAKAATTNDPRHLPWSARIRSGLVLVASLARARRQPTGVNLFNPLRSLAKRLEPPA